MTPIGGLGTPIDGTILLAREQTIRSRNNCLNTGKSKVSKFLWDNTYNVCDILMEISSMESKIGHFIRHLDTFIGTVINMIHGIRGQTQRLGVVARGEVAW